MVQKLISKLSAWHDAGLKFALAAILIAVPLYPKFPFINIPGTFVSVRLEDILLALSSILVFLRIFPRIKTFLKNPVNRSFAIFLFSGFLSLLSAVLITKTVEPSLGFLHWLRRIEYIVPFYLALEVLRKNRKNKLNFYFNILVIVVITVFIYGFGQKNLNWPVIITQNEEYSKGVALRHIPGGHLNSTFAGHYDLGTFLVMVLPVLVSALVVISGRGKKVVLGLTIVAGLWLLVNTASRISMVSYLLSVSSALFFLKRVKLIPIVVIVSLVFIGFSSNLQARYQRIINVTKDKVFELNLINYDLFYIHASEDTVVPQRKTIVATPTPVPIYEDRSTNIRLNVEWPRALRALRKNPLLGTGYSSISLATDNDYLRLLGETGFLGFFSFFLVFINLFNIILRKFPFIRNLEGLELVFVSGIVGAIPGIFLNAMFIDVFEASKFAITFWLMMGIIVSITSYEKLNKPGRKN